MKLKLHIPETEKTIKVKDITGGLARGFLGPSPRIIFSVNLEEELLLCYATNIGANKFIFVDSKMREYAHGNYLVLREYYYEKGTTSNESSKLVA